MEHVCCHWSSRLSGAGLSALIQNTISAFVHQRSVHWRRAICGPWDARPTQRAPNEVSVRSVWRRRPRRRRGVMAEPYEVRHLPTRMPMGATSALSVALAAAAVSGRMEREWSKVQRCGAGAEGEFRDRARFRPPHPPSEDNNFLVHWSVDSYVSVVRKKKKNSISFHFCNG
jgi:hypothetical protein